MEGKKLSREDLVELAKKIINADTETEEEDDELIELFLKSVPDPNASDYFFAEEYDGLTPEQIVDKALAYKP
jgi:hypothetical protein